MNYFLTGYIQIKIQRSKVKMIDQKLKHFHTEAQRHGVYNLISDGARATLLNFGGINIFGHRGPQVAEE
jgi:hypothetical protein